MTLRDTILSIILIFIVVTWIGVFYALLGGCATGNELGTLKTTVGDVQQEADTVANQTGAVNVQSNGAPWVFLSLGIVVTFVVWLMHRIFKQRQMLLDLITSVKCSQASTQNEIKTFMSIKKSKRDVKRFAEKHNLIA